MADHTLAEAGALLGLSPSTLRHQAQVGTLKARLVGKTYVVPDREIERYRRDHLGKRRLRETHPTRPYAEQEAAAERAAARTGDPDDHSIDSGATP